MADTRTPLGPSADNVRTHALEPAMDGIAAGDTESGLLHTEIDLLVEAAHIIDKLAGLVGRICETNGIAIACDRKIAGWADRLAAHLHDLEHNAPSHQRPLSGRRLAHELIGILDELANGPLEAQPMARKHLHELFAAIPRDQIFRQAVYDHVGARRRPLLMDEYDRWVEKRAARTSRRRGVKAGT